MGASAGTSAAESTGRRTAFLWIPVSFFAIDLFAFCFLTDFSEGLMPLMLWPLAFGLVWAVLLSSLVRLLPRKGGRIAYGILFYLGFIYAGAQTGYHFMFEQLMWLSDFRYASEGSDYASVILSFPVSWWISLLALGVFGGILIWKFPRWNRKPSSEIVSGVLAAGCIAGAVFLPQAVFLQDSNVRFAGSDYGRSQSAEAAYTNMFNAKRLYEVCGLWQTGVKDVYANVIFPLTPSHAKAQAEGRARIDAYFGKQPEHADNDMTGIFEGKNVVLVLMESMDDWLIGEHTPTISRLMSEGINFTRFYTPVYGGIRTFNTEFCTNTGSFLSSQGGYAFDYVTNDFDQSLPNLLRDRGYTAKTFHYNDPSFYSRGEFSPAMGYEDYVYYGDFVEPDSDELYDDKLLFDNGEINDIFFREGAPRLNFIITRSAHLSYKYNEVLSYWGLKQYPEYRGLTGHEEEDCAYLKARLVDDMYTRLLEELEAHGELQNTVIIGITDHYTYGIKDEDLLYSRSGVEEPLMLEKTPCFIWSADMEPLEYDKILNTSDMLPTMLNLLGVESPYHYIGHDAFDPSYPGFVPFSDGSWIVGGVGFNAETGDTFYLDQPKPLSGETFDEISQAVAEFAEINNLILETNYYGKK